MNLLLPISIKNLLFILSIIIFSGCDGKRYMHFSSIENKFESSVLDKKSVDLLFEKVNIFLDKFAIRNELKCLSYSKEKLSRECYKESIGIFLKRKENTVDLYVWQTGPLNVTKEYNNIRIELVNLLTKQFPDIYLKQIR